MALDTNAGSTTLTAGRRNYLPKKYLFGKAISTIGVIAGSVATTGNVRISVYEWRADGSPGALITEFTSAAQIGINTATGMKSITLGTPFWLPPGWYYFMVQADAAVQLISAIPYANCGAGIINTRDVMSAYKDATYGAAPTTADTGLNGVTRSSGNQIAIFVK
jgi:hypothetical protein